MDNNIEYHADVIISFSGLTLNDVSFTTNDCFIIIKDSDNKYTWYNKNAFKVLKNVTIINE